MVREVVDRVVGRAAHAHPRAQHQSPGRESHLPELRVARFPERVRGLDADRCVDGEVAAQLKVAPVVEGVADAQRQHRAKAAELLLIRRAAGDEVLGNARGAHKAPFIVVAAEPELGHVAEPPVLRDLRRWQVAMVVDDRLRRRVLVVELARGRRLEQKILVHERLGHRCRSPLGQTPEYAENPPSTGTTIPLTKPEASSLASHNSVPMQLVATGRSDPSACVDDLAARAASARRSWHRSAGSGFAPTGRSPVRSR